MIVYYGSVVADTKPDVIEGFDSPEKSPWLWVGVVIALIVGGIVVLCVRQVYRTFQDFKAEAEQRAQTQATIRETLYTDYRPRIQNATFPYELTDISKEFAADPRVQDLELSDQTGRFLDTINRQLETRRSQLEKPPWQSRARPSQRGYY